MAKKYKMPVLANENSKASRALAEKGIRRGKLAQLMASYYYGKTVSETKRFNFSWIMGLLQRHQALSINPTKF